MQTPPYQTPPFTISIQMPNGQPAPTITLTWTQGWQRWLNEVGKAGRVIVQDQTLAANVTTTIGAPQPIREGIVLLQVVRQGGVAGKIAWDASFDQAPVDIDITPNTESLYLFLGHNGKWLFVYANPGRPVSA